MPDKYGYIHRHLYGCPRRRTPRYGEGSFCVCGDIVVEAEKESDLTYKKYRRRR